MHPGGLELEQYIDVIPIRVLRENPDGTLDGVWATRYQLQTEFEYGITDRLELGIYMAWRQGASATVPAMRFEGIKQRVRFRVSDPTTWPIGVATYLEVAELYGEVELEEKLLLSWQSGPLEVVANFWVEQEYYFADSTWKHIYNPTAGVTWELTPRATVGLEYWARGRFDAAEEAAGDESDTGGVTRHYLGPTLMLQGGEHWLALGAYARVDTGTIAIGDPYGRLWVRLIVGLGL
jgi:hypothetical protein